MANATKITFTANTGLKTLKKEYGFKSISAVIEEAVKNYKQEKERLRWKRGYELAAQDSEYQDLCNEIASDDGGLYEYQTK